ncbi:flagellar hook-associated protein FlgK [Candidatus Latescibacterota bacterium]
MSGLFFGLNIARNTLRAQTSVLNTTAHNIANANTPGYSRQKTVLSSVTEKPIGGIWSGGTLNVGGGAEATEIARYRFALYDQIFRNENQNLNDFIKTEELMHQVELLFDEPSDRGLSATISAFFNGWQEVASEPQNMAARQSLKSITEELTSRFQRIYLQLDTMREDINTEITAIPPLLNEITEEIASLNASIRVATGQKSPANDLKDKRDSLVDELSEYVDVKVVEQKDGTYTVLMGAHVVVELDHHSELHAVTRTVGAEANKRTVIVSDEGLEYTPYAGKVGALVKFRDNILTGIMGKLTEFTENFVEWINFEHRLGYGLDKQNNRNFFDPFKTNPYNITVSTDIRDITHIAVSGDGTVGDNTNALRIHELKNMKLIDQRYTFNEYYGALIAEVGINGREAKSGRMNEELLVRQVDNAREGIRGVSMDEEIIQMIQAQYIYQGASRIIRVLDTLLEEIIRLK